MCDSRLVETCRRSAVFFGAPERRRKVSQILSAEEINNNKAKRVEVENF